MKIIFKLQQYVINMASLCFVSIVTLEIGIPSLDGESQDQDTNATIIIYSCMTHEFLCPFIPACCNIIIWLML